MRFAHPNGDYLNIEKHEKDERGGMRFAQNRRTKQAQSQTRLSFALQGGGRRKSNLRKSFENLLKICDGKASWEVSCFSCLSMFPNSSFPFSGQI